MKEGIKNLNVQIPASLKDQFSKAAREVKGQDSGSLKAAMMEAIKDWMAKNGHEYQDPEIK